MYACACVRLSLSLSLPSLYRVPVPTGRGHANTGGANSEGDRQKFSKVLCIVALRSKYTRTLICSEFVFLSYPTSIIIYFYLGVHIQIYQNLCTCQGYILKISEFLYFRFTRQVFWRELTSRGCVLY